jgi:hypothetical protein
MSLESFFESSTIHGFRYLSRRFHWIERLFWLLCLISSLALSIVLITKLVENIKHVPVIVQISNQPVSVGEVDFPAVTMCYGLIQMLASHIKLTKPKSGILRYYRFERHNNLKYVYEPEEFDEERFDERRLGNLSYLDILTKIEKSEVKVDDLGVKM